MSVWTGWQKDLLDSIGAPNSPDNTVILNAWHLSVDTSGKLNPLGVRAKTPISILEAPSGVANYATKAKAVAAFKAKIAEPFFGGMWADLRDGSVDPLEFEVRNSAELATWRVNVELYQVQVQSLQGGLTTTAGPSRGFATSWQDMLNVFSKQVPAQRRALSNRASALSSIFK